MIDWGEILKMYLAGMSLTHFIAYYVAMAAGAVVYFGLDVGHSTRSNQDTPKKFSLKFMILDNLVRGIAVMIMMAGAVVFYEDLYGTTINIKLAFTTGLGLDALIGTVLKTGKERGPWKKSRDKLVQKYST